MKCNDLHLQCPICSSSDLDHRFEVAGFKIDHCRSCDLVFVRERMSNEELSGYYQDAGGDEVYCNENADCLNYYYRNLKTEIEKYREQPGRVLDVGCSSGLFLDGMTGWDRYGCEWSAAQGEKAIEKYGDGIFIGSFSDYPLREQFFDVITMQDVLDHCIDPVAVLRQCKLMLKPKGMIVIKVHNISCLYARLTGRNFYAVIPPYHLFYFNKRSLGVLLESTGFQPVRYAFMPHLLKLQTIFYRLSRGNQNVWSRLFALLKNTTIGNIRMRKNLHDIVTVFARAD